MSKRLQVILEDDEMREIRRLARQQRTTVAEWVRRALRAVRSQQPAVAGERKIQAIRAAVRHSLPTADIEVMLGEIEAGYLRE